LVVCFLYEIYINTIKLKEDDVEKETRITA
jgi:hypothetical protein